jgi:hypothetical protein
MLLTIRNLTSSYTDRMFSMNVITVRRTLIYGTPKKPSMKRMVINGNSKKRSTTRRSFRELARAYFARENSLEFAIEALLFVIIVAISAWPIFTAAGALNEFFQRAPV